MTLVWQTQRGALIQTQVGTIDIVNTWSAAASVYGWLGGTERLRFLFDRLPFRNRSRERLCELKLDHQLRLQPLRALVLTSSGPLVAHMDDMRDSFGGDLRTQVIGTTICALAHELDRFTAANLFRRFLMPYLFGEETLLLDTLQSQLLEESTLQKIINEGSSRGLNDMFLETAASSGVPPTGQTWRDKTPFENGNNPLLGEVKLIAGFLKWLASGAGLEYRTRSALVARIAMYLKAVVYSIGSIHIWTGHGEPPSPIGARCLLLVLGGSSETDTCMPDPEDVQTLTSQPKLHYQFSTIGALLLSAMGTVVDIAPETLQEDFQHIFAYIQEHLEITYFAEDGSIYATYKWRKSTWSATPTATRLASLYFPESAEVVAPCFDRIASETYLNLVRKRQVNQELRQDSKELGRLRATNASVVISIISRFAPDTFASTRHATDLDLFDQGWLSEMCEFLDRVKNPSLPEVVYMLAGIHVGPLERTAEKLGLGFEKLSSRGYKGSKTVAWRDGIYSVVPSFLLQQDLRADNIRFVCLDQFWANVRTRDDGSITSSYGPGMQRYEVNISESPISTDISALERQENKNSKDYHLGSSEASAPDRQLYLCLGTPMHIDNSSEVCYVAWINGSVAGTVGIADVFFVLVASNVEPELCPGHDADPLFINIRTSTWVQNYWDKPQSKQHPILVSARGDTGWAIFAAGQIANQDGRIVFRCPTCALQNYNRARALENDSDGPHAQGCFIALMSSNPFPRAGQIGSSPNSSP